MGHPVFDRPRPFVIAHRGGAGEALENSMSAFVRASQLGVAAIEADLQVTADGVCVISHDQTLDRTTDLTGEIGHLSWHEVSRARIGGTESILRLEELLEGVTGIALNLDLKTDAVVPAFVRTLRSSPHLERLCVGSFSDARLGHVRREFGRRLATSLGPREIARLKFADRSPRSPSVVAAQVPERAGPVKVVTAGFVARATRAGLQVHVWTIDDPVAMRRLLALGVAGLVTDRPSVALAEVAAFGIDSH